MGKPIIRLGFDAKELAKLIQVEVGKPFPAHFGKFHDYFAGLIILSDDGEMRTFAKLCLGGFGKLDYAWQLDEDEKLEVIHQRLDMLNVK